MKYLKLFENKVLDNILDKINLTGMDSLTSLEKEFLDKYGYGDTDKHKEVEKELIDRDTKYHDAVKYDPREDDFFKGSSMDFSDWDDKEIEESRYDVMWEGLYDEDMDSFLKTYKLPNDTREQPWDKLYPKIKEFFKEYLLNIGLME